MNRETTHDDSGVSTGSDDVFDDLFKHTKPRQRPPEADEQAIRHSLHAEWQAVVGRRIWAIRASWGAAAAVLVLAAVVLLQNVPGVPSDPELVASIERLEGSIQISRDGEILSSAATGDAILAGQGVDTRTGAVALQLSRGGSLRVAADSRINFVSVREVELLRGTLYFDSRGAPEDSGAALTIRTRLGSVRDLGTQFIAELEPDSLGVSVREGSILIDMGSEQFEAGIGERLSVDADGGSVRGSIALYGDEWDWAEQLAPTFQIEGRSVFEFLAWIERETGRHVVFTSTQAEAQAKASVLRGAIDLQPMPMLRAVMATTNFSYTVTAGEIAVSTGL
jgi:ferric-dicitrate binding protein FerR (iron transport regulator)